MSLFLLVGLFVFKSGHRAADDEHVQYQTTVACLQQLPIPANISVRSALTEPILQDGTAVFVIGRTFVPSHSATGPILIDAVKIAPVPGDPTDEHYHQHTPTFPVPFVIAEGTIASADATGPSAALSFPLAVSDYVRSSVKSSTVAFASSFTFIFSFTHNLLRYT